MFQNKNKDENKTSISIIELLAYRKEILTSKRLKIGLLSSNLLETPETKCENFKALLELMEETNPEVYITVRKLATVSLMEVFKDLLPSYQILQIPQEGVKCMYIIIYKRQKYTQRWVGHLEITVKCHQRMCVRHGFDAVR